MPIAGLIADRLQYTGLILLVLFIFFVGGALYAVAENVWIVFLGRGLMGGAASFCGTVVHMYMGEMGTIMDEVRVKQGKRPMKFAVYIAISFMLNGGYILPYGQYNIATRIQCMKKVPHPNTRSIIICSNCMLYLLCSQLSLQS